MRKDHIGGIETDSVSSRLTSNQCRPTRAPTERSEAICRRERATVCQHPYTAAVGSSVGLWLDSIRANDEVAELLRLYFVRNAASCRPKELLNAVPGNPFAPAGVDAGRQIALTNSEFLPTRIVRWWTGSAQSNLTSSCHTPLLPPGFPRMSIIRSWVLSTACTHDLSSDSNPSRAPKSLSQR